MILDVVVVASFAQSYKTTLLNSNSLPVVVSTTSGQIRNELISCKWEDTWFVNFSSCPFPGFNPLPKNGLHGIKRHRLWKLIQDFYFCSIYDARPVEKRVHIFLERSYTRVSEAKRESSFVLKKLVWPRFSPGRVYCKLNKNKNPRLKFLQTMTYHILYQSFP